MRYTLVREQNRNVAISVGVRPAAHNSRTCTASKEPYRACRNSASIHSCSGGGISSMVEPRTVRPPRYLGGVATLEIPKRPSLCQSHASWFSGKTTAEVVRNPPPASAEGGHNGRQIFRGVYRRRRLSSPTWT